MWVSIHFLAVHFPFPGYIDTTTLQRKYQSIRTKFKHISCGPVAYLQRILIFVVELFATTIISSQSFQRVSTKIVFGQTGAETKIGAEISVCHQKLRNMSKNDSVLTSLSRHTAASNFQCWSGTCWTILSEVFYVQLIAESATIFSDCFVIIIVLQSQSIKIREHIAFATIRHCI